MYTVPANITTDDMKKKTVRFYGYTERMLDGKGEIITHRHSMIGLYAWQFNNMHKQLIAQGYTLQENKKTMGTSAPVNVYLREYSEDLVSRVFITESLHPDTVGND